MKRIEELTLKLADGQLTEAEATELDALLAAEPGAAADQTPLFEIEGALRGLREGIDYSGPLIERLQELNERQVEAVMKRIDRLPAPRRKAPVSGWSARRRPILSLLTAAAAVVLLLWATGWISPPANAAAFARLAQVEGLVEIIAPSGRTQTADAGLTLTAGQTVRTGAGESAARIEYADRRGTLELGADTVFRCGPQGYLSSGMLRGHWQEGAAPLVIATAQFTVSARQGDLSVEAFDSDASRVRVESGRAEVVRHADGQAVAVAAGELVVVSSDLEALVARRGPPNRAASRQTDVKATFACFAPDGRTVVAVAGHDIVYWQADNALKTYRHQFVAGGGSPALAANGKTLAIPLRDGGISLWDLVQRKEQTRIANQHPVRRLALAPDASWVAGLWPRGPSAEAGKAYLWDVPTGAERLLTQLSTSVGNLAAAPDGRLVAVASGIMEENKRKIFLVEPGTGKTVGVLPRPGRLAGPMTFSPDSQVLAVSYQSTLQLWQVATRTLAQAVPTQGRSVSALTFSPDGRVLAWSGSDGSVVLWDIAGERELDSWYVGPFGIASLTFAPHGKALAVVCPKHGLFVWDLRPAVKE